MTSARMTPELKPRHHVSAARILAMALLAFLTTAALPCAGQQSKSSPHSLPPELRNKCAMCHSCTTPTRSNPCLITCPRVKESTGRYTPADGPGVMLMSSMKGQFGPVPFNHRSHAQMAEMSGGCYGCHHYNDTALGILSCASCHPENRKRENVTLPDLKAAYHRRCLDCHRQWTGSPECKSCHLDKSDGKSAAQILAENSKVRKDHPTVPIPDKKVFVTKEQDATVVTFFHNDHTKKFGLACVDCHRQEGCVGCHDRRPEELRKKSSPATTDDFESRHARCVSCHEGQPCTKCHAAKEAQPFEHGRATGWTLKTYHERLACARCHGASRKFAALNSECASCHSPWPPESFTHSITGLKLDETHAAVDCIECHPGKSFEKPPVCSGCHDDKSYPTFKPGTAAGS